MEETNKMIPAKDKLANAVQVIKDAILQSQQRALDAVNQEQLALYYGIGRYVSANTRTKNWGKGFIEGISEQLRKELPGLRGFSARNLRNMRTFYEEWQILESPNLAVQTAKLENDKQNSLVETNKDSNSAVATAEIQGKDEIRQLRLTISPDFPIAAFFSLSFTHHTSILSNIKSYEERKFYIQFAVDYKVKCEDLEQLMKDDLYNHQGSLPNNFRRTIPDQLQAYRAITMFKDEYLLDYINTEELFVRDKDRDERVIEQSIINNVKDFIMTFGRDFTFVGNQYHLEKFGINSSPIYYSSTESCQPLSVWNSKTAHSRLLIWGSWQAICASLMMRFANPMRIHQSALFFVKVQTRNSWNMLSKTMTSRWA